MDDNLGLLNIIWFICWIMMFFGSIAAEDVGVWKYPALLGIAFALPILTFVVQGMNKIMRQNDKI